MKTLSDFKWIDNPCRKQHFRFFELIDLVNKKDGRSLEFEDKGYVEDVESFLTGACCQYPMFFNIDSSTSEWELLSDVKKFKTLIDFYNNKITCQGFYYKDLPGYKRDWFQNIKIIGTCINPCTVEEREFTRKYLKM